MSRTHGYRAVWDAVVRVSGERSDSAVVTIVDPKSLTVDALYQTKKINSREEFLEFLRDTSGALPDIDRGR